MGKGSMGYKEDQLRFMLYNPRSLNNKIYLVMAYLVDNSVDVAGICETWLPDKNNPTTAVIKIKEMVLKAPI